VRRLCRGLALAWILGAVAAMASPAYAQRSPAPQIIGGGDAATGAFPYAAFIKIDYTEGSTQVSASCSGSLIAANVVLTAGHCAFDESTGQQLQPGSYKVTLGLTDISLAASSPANVLSVSQVIPYPYFDPHILQGDAALLVLSSPAPAGAVAIPLATSSGGSLYAAGEQATILGWGVTSNAPGADVPAILQTGTVAVQSNATCDAAEADGSFRPAFDLCVAAPGFTPTTCFGDSGSPLVVSTAAGPVETGVDSYGLGQACGSSPDYFTRASSIQPWVASVIAGVPVPSVFVPAFVAPAPVAALSADGVAVSFATPAADPATILTGFVATLLNAAGTPVSTQNLPPTTPSAGFPGLQPGTYSVGVVATYTEGSSAQATSLPVTLKPPSNTTRPALKGRAVVGSRLTCHKGTWLWPGASTLDVAWLRNGTATGKTAATYKLGSADAGKKVACRVTLKSRGGATATATSAAVLAGLELRLTKSPRISGSAAPGRTLTCLAGTWTHSGTLKLSYRWLRSGRTISGKAAAVARRVVGPADLGRTLSCRVTAAAGGQSAARATRVVTVRAA
jgi:secreted trypsin-like serine protease